MFSVVLALTSKFPPFKNFSVVFAFTQKFPPYFDFSIVFPIDKKIPLFSGVFCRLCSNLKILVIFRWFHCFLSSLHLFKTSQEEQPQHFVSPIATFSRFCNDSAISAIKVTGFQFVSGQLWQFQQCTHCLFFCINILSCKVRYAEDSKTR
jgi:hypothetical protein